MKNKKTTGGRTVRRARRKEARLELRLPTFALWTNLRAPFERWFASLPLPQVNPDVVSGICLLLAFLFVAAVYQGGNDVAWVFLAAHLFLCGIADALARQWRAAHDRDDLLHAQRLDLFVDRASELLLFSAAAFLWPWLFLFVVNTFLTLLSMLRHRSYILPLRLAFFVYFTLTLVF